MGEKKARQKKTVPRASGGDPNRFAQRGGAVNCSPRKRG